VTRVALSRLLPFFTCWGVATVAWAQPVSPADQGSIDLAWVGMLGAAALLPALLVVLTAFAKVFVVLGIFRSALGANGVPPTLVIFGLSVLLTLFIMAPVVEQMWSRAEAAWETEDQPPPLPGEEAPAQWRLAVAGLSAAAEPLRDFLRHHAHAPDVALFEELSGDRPAPTDATGELLVLMPAFALSELKEAFQMGFLILIPFLIIDLVIANILMSLGMQTLNPTSVSLPFKLLLFVLVDGWVLLAEGLVTSYLGGGS
jgi:flagellar biosynthesis protein FliP